MVIRDRYHCGIAVDINRFNLTLVNHKYPRTAQPVEGHKLFYLHLLQWKLSDAQLQKLKILFMKMFLQAKGMIVFEITSRLHLKKDIHGDCSSQLTLYINPSACE